MLKDDGTRRVVRVGDVVVRPGESTSSSVQGFLVHLHARGFTDCPRPLGLTEDGREMESVVPGEPTTKPWPAPLLSGDCLGTLGELVRRMHDAAEGFRPVGWEWKRDGHRDVGEGEIVLHGDLRPSNLMFTDGAPSAIVDFEYANPGDPRSDLAVMGFHVAPMRTDDWCRAAGFDSAPDRRARLAALVEGYGRWSPAEMVDVAVSYLDEESDRIRTRGALGHQPWQDLATGGHIGTIATMRAWIVEHRDLLC